MNEKLQDFARDDLKKGLAQCTEGQQRLFKQMYAHENRDKDINFAVYNMPNERLDWAMEQVERTLNKNNKINEQ